MVCLSHGTMVAKPDETMTTRTSNSNRDPNVNRRALKWNLKLGRVLGIDVNLHITFVLILGFLALAHWLPGRSIEAAFHSVLFFIALFACVLFHEFGHALAARRFGVGTRDITLLPIGGVARLERMPDKPLEEFWIAVAGPSVNVIIAILLACWLAISSSWTPFGAISATIGGLAELMLIKSAVRRKPDGVVFSRSTAGSRHVPPPLLRAGDRQPA